jgi:hypothetical protein
VPPVPIHLIALVTAAMVRTVIGVIWFSPALFGPRWIALAGCTEQDMKRRLPRALVIDAVANFVMAFVLAHAIYYAGGRTAALGAAVGFFNWIGIAMVATLFTVTFEGRPFRLFAINNGFHAVSMIAMGAILAAWT